MRPIRPFWKILVKMSSLKQRKELIMFINATFSSLTRIRNVFLIINFHFFRLVGRSVGLQKVFGCSDLEESSPNLTVFDVSKAFTSNLLYGYCV